MVYKCKEKDTFCTNCDGFGWISVSKLTNCIHDEAPLPILHRDFYVFVFLYGVVTPLIYTYRHEYCEVK